MNELKPTKSSLELVQKISEKVDTFHHHYHILYDIAQLYPNEYKLNYVEIGCYAGASACLMLQRPNTSVVSIDIGKPISKEVVNNNIQLYNQKKNKYRYILGSSHDQSTIDILKKNITDIDILFIDGDHSYDGVLADFTMYETMVKPNGYIVFDDYNDKNAPGINKAVHELIHNNKFNNYDIIGSLDNDVEAKPATLLKSNEFILKKKINLV